MKNRNWLVFALCAMMGAAGAACSDDGGNNQTAFKVEPSSITMSVGGRQSVMVTGTAGANFSVTSNNPNCSKVTAQESTIPANGVLYFEVEAAGKVCANNLEVIVGEEKQYVAVDITENTSSAVISTTTMDPLVLGGKGSTADVDLSYKKDGEAVADKVLETVVKIVSYGTEGEINNSNDCVQVAESVKTNAMGLTTLNVEAIDANCSAKIIVKDTSTPGAELTINVNVGGNANAPIEGEIKFFDPEDELGIKQSDKKSEFTVLLIDKNTGKEIADTYVTITSSDESCVTLEKATLKTGADGKATGVAQMADGVGTTGCEAKLTAEALKVKDEIKVTVLDKDKFTVSSKINFRKDNEKCKTTPANAVCACDDTTVDECIAHPMYPRIGYVGAIINDVSCEDIFGDVEAEEYGEFIQSYKDSDADFSKEMFMSDAPELTTLSLKNLDSDAKSVIVYGKVDGSKESGIMAFACKDISIADDYDKKKKNYVAIELDAILPDMIGQYEIVSNFDLTSGFQKTDCNIESTYKGNGICVPKVEEMLAGDWVKFMTDFCTNPLMTVLEFAWSNTILRLGDIKALKDYDWLTDFLSNPSIKITALAALEPTLEKLLAGTGEWYTILKKVAPDVADLTKNMQLYGNLDVKKVDGAEIVQATQKYMQLQYQWSYNEPSDKLDDAYGIKSGSWRRPIKLGGTKHDTAMQGEWTGVISSDIEAGAEYDALLNIDKSEISFKWATLLYTAVFGYILPETLGYKDAPSVSSGLYIKALLEKLVFQPIVDAYNKKAADVDKVAVDKDNPQYCNYFISALVYMLWAEIKGGTPGDIVKNVLDVVAGFACGEEGIGQLDKLAIDALNKLEIGSTQINFQIAADNCPISSNENTQVSMIGGADNPYLTANQVIYEEKETNRCTWNVDTGIVSDDKNVMIQGIFHATRIDEE